MKSVYGRLIIGFILTLVFSFSVTGYVAYRQNFANQATMVAEDLENATDYIAAMIRQVHSKNEFDVIINSYIDEYSLTCQINKNGVTHNYGKTSEHDIKDYDVSNLKEVNQQYIGSKGFVYYTVKRLRYDGNVYVITVGKDMTRTNQSVLNSYLLSALVMFLVGCLVFLILADFITKPISNLTKATEELAKGNYKVRVQYSGNSEMAKLNRAFNQMAMRLGKQEEIRQQFISDVSHEFQTPLTAIQGFATILKNENLSDEMREKYADIIIFNTKRLSTLSKNMLQLTLLEVEDIELDYTDFSLIDQLNRIIETEDSAALAKDIEIEFVKPRGDIIINADELRLEQVWVNIISNAIKYTKEHGVITVEVKRVAKGVDVSIADTGVGMSQEDIAHIFDRFYRIDKSRAVEGNGLGLAIVKRIIDLHEYSIDVQSQEDVGSVFTVHIPLESRASELAKKLSISNLRSTQQNN